MHEPYQQRDSMWDEPPAAELPPARPNPVGAIVAGVLAVVGGVALAVGPFLDYLTVTVAGITPDFLPGADPSGETFTQLDGLVASGPIMFVGLAGVVAAAGILALAMPRHPVGTFAVGAVATSGLIIAGIQGGENWTVIDVLRQSDGDTTEPFEIGMWVLLGGIAVTAAAALVALITMLTRLGRGTPAAVPLLGVIGAAGLMMWVVLPAISAENRPVWELSVVDLNTTDTWYAVAAIGVVALVVGAVIIAASRAGMAAVGAALGATVAVGLDMVTRVTLDFGDSALLDLYDEALYVGIATAAVLAILTVATAVVTARAREPESEDMAAAWASEYPTQAIGGSTAWGQAEADPWATTRADTGATSAWPQPEESTGAWQRDPDPGWPNQPESESAWTRDEDAGRSWDDRDHRPGQQGWTG